MPEELKKTSDSTPEGGSAQQQNSEPKDELQVMREQLSRLEAQLKEANSRLSDPSYIEYLARKALGEKGDSGKPEAPTTPATLPKPQLPEDFEEMTPSQFLDVLKESVKEELLPHLGQVAGAVARLESRMEIERVASKYDDFDEYLPEMQKLVEENPYLHPEQAYLLAKEIRKKSAPPEKPGASEQTVSLAEKIAKELRGSGALPGEAPEVKERIRGRSVGDVASKIFDKLTGGG